jgi:hypothetical protein
MDRETGWIMVPTGSRWSWSVTYEWLTKLPVKATAYVKIKVYFFHVTRLRLLWTEELHSWRISKHSSIIRSGKRVMLYSFIIIVNHKCVFNNKSLYTFPRADNNFGKTAYRLKFPVFFEISCFRYGEDSKPLCPGSVLLCRDDILREELLLVVESMWCTFYTDRHSFPLNVMAWQVWGCGLLLQLFCLLLWMSYKQRYWWGVVWYWIRFDCFDVDWFEPKTVKRVPRNYMSQ